MSENKQSLIPDIETVRALTAVSDEQITKTWEEKYIKAIANGIWQQTKGGKYEHFYTFISEGIDFKEKAMERVEKAYRRAGYTVTRLNHNLVDPTAVTIRFSWIKENI